MSTKKVGRKERFSTEKLSSIIDSYFANNKVYGQVNATQIAEYAEKSLGYEGIKYYHFNRNPEIKSIIDDSNNIFQFNISNNKQTFIPFNSDKFFETYKNDPKSTKIILRQFANRYEELNLKVLELETIKLQYEAKIENLENQNTNLKKKSREMKQRNESISKSCIKLQNFKKFSDKVAMLSYLKQQGLIASLDEENLRLLLANCNLINFNDSFEDESIEPEAKATTEENDTAVIPIDKYNHSENESAVKNAIDILNKRLKR